MIDVHPPEHRIHGVRDFFLHLFTITIGLLIALALEAGVERIHQRHLRAEADENICAEVQANLNDLEHTRAVVPQELTQLTALQAFLQTRSDNKPIEPKQMQQMGFAETTLSDASWRTATTTGALGLMPFGRVQQFSSAYELQELFTRLELGTVDSLLKLQSTIGFDFNPATFSPERARDTLPVIREAITRIKTSDQLAEQLEINYKTVLQGKK